MVRRGVERVNLYNFAIHKQRIYIQSMLISINELQLRCDRISEALTSVGGGSILLRSIPNHLYLTGTVFSGYTFLEVGKRPFFFYDRPTSIFEDYVEERAFAIRKPEQIPDILKSFGSKMGSDTLLEGGTLPHLEYLRLSALAEGGEVHPADASQLMREVRSIKTEMELTTLRSMGLTHMEIYRLAPDLWEPGITDLEWQHRLEFRMRRRGSIGIFRAYGPRMEIFMGNVSAGDNSDTPAPYDFAMGGAGTPAMPMGANGTPIEEGMPVMIDLAGNYGVYNTDMTRVYAAGDVDEELQRAHDLSISLQEWFADNVREGTLTSEIYNHCVEEVRREGFEENFMGHTFQAKFVGHGVGIEINELPVLMERRPVPLQKGMVVAFEPKFVFPGKGAVGIENTFEITPQGSVNITPYPMEIIPLGK